MISREEILMGRDVEFPLSDELEANLGRLLDRLALLRIAYGMPMTVSSGYRPGYYNTDADGALNSPHLTCEACDFKDPEGEIDRWCISNLTLLRGWGLRLESPAWTPGWCHIDTRFVDHVLFVP